MNPFAIAKALGITIEPIPRTKNPDGSFTSGTYKPGSGSSLIFTTSSQHFTILHELAHAIHDRLYPHAITFDNLLHCEIVADIVAINLSLLDGDLPDPDCLSFSYSGDLLLDYSRALPTATAILTYILNVIQSTC